MSSGYGPLAPAWVRDGSELYLLLWLVAILSFLVPVLGPLLAVSFFFPFSQAIPYKPDIQFSVYIRPICINALCT